MKKQNLLNCAFIFLLSLFSVSFSNDDKKIVKANDNELFATIIDSSGNIDYVTYNEVNNNITSTSSYIPMDSLNLGLEDFFELVSPNLVFGSDDRTTLQPSQYTLFPYRAVCRIFVEFDSNNDGVMDGNGVGTGVFVGPSTILTCNHIMYSKEHGWPDRIEIGPGAYKNGNKIEYPNGKITSWSSLSIGNNHNTGKNDDDWAIIDLDANYGSSLGYFGVSSTAISVGSTVRLYGYHGDIPDQISYGPGTVTYLETYKFYHNCDAISGSSGGPITYGTTTVVGIHSGGVNQNEDAACKVSSYIVGWINERLNS